MPTAFIIRMVSEENTRLHKSSNFHMFSHQLQDVKSVPADWVMNMKARKVTPCSMSIRAASVSTLNLSSHDLDFTHDNDEQESKSINPHLNFKMFISIILSVSSNQMMILLFRMIGLIYPTILKIKQCISTKS